MELLFSFIAIGVIGLLAAMSPGPDFAVVVKNSLLYSRRAALFTSLGIGLGIFVHVAYSLVGIGFVISQSIVLFSIIKFLGAGYLIYLGIQLLSSKAAGTDMSVTKQAENNEISDAAALRQGFLTNALNPKATLFFLSVFTQVIDPSTTLIVQGLYGAEIAVIVYLWFTALTFVLTMPVAKKVFSRLQRYVAKVMGGALIFLGIKVALAARS